MSVERGGEKFSGYNKPKRTPNHPTKSHAVLAKEGDRIKLIRFGQQGVKGAGSNPKTDKQKARKKSFKARHAKNIKKGKMSAAFWADKVKWEDGGSMNTTGYLDDSPTEDNMFNLIPSNRITMEGVDKNIIGIGLDDNGDIAEMKFMKPEEKHIFEQANAVLEIPQYQTGGGMINPLTGQPYDMDEVTLYGNNPQNQDFLNQLDQDVAAFEENNALTEAQKNLDFANTLPQYEGMTQEQMKNRANTAINETAPTGQKSLTPPEQIQFANPYTSIDIPTAANLLGQSIENKDTAGGILSGLKVGTGIARNIFSGMGQARRNQFVLDEYNQGQRNALTQASYKEGGKSEWISNKIKKLIDEGKEQDQAVAIAYSMYENRKQAGGELTGEDVLTINRATPDVEFTPETINSLFERVQIPERESKYTPDLGRYGSVGYFDIGQVTDKEINLTPTKKNPHNVDTIKELIPYLQERNPGRKVNIKYNFEDGGEIKKEEILTGEYSGPDAGSTNAEIEDGEYRDDKQRVTEVKGDSHENGGVEVNMDEGERILSDHTKIGSDTAKMFKEKYELDVKAKSTYADVLDSFKKKSGLKKITDEMEEIIKKTEKEMKKDDSSAKNINLQFLSEKLNELEQKKKPLDEVMQKLFDKTYSIQESKKQDKEPQTSFQIGGQMYNSDQIVEIGKRYGIDPDRAKEIIMKMGGRMDKYQPGGEVGYSLGYVPEGQSQDPSTGLYGDVDLQKYSEAQLRNPWFDFTDFDPSNKEDVLNFQKQFNQQAVQAGVRPLREDGLWGEETNSAFLGTVKGAPMANNFDPNIDAPLLNTKVASPSPEQETAQVAEQEDGQGLMLPLLPDQSPLPPSALQPVLKNQRRYGRMESVNIDPTAQLEEINRQAQSAQQAASQLPDSARTAALAQIVANTQASASDVIAKANQYNQINDQRTEAFNIRQSDREVDAGAQDALSYEQRMLLGLSNTENDIRDYFQTLQDLQITNKKTIDRLNYLNAMNENYQFTGDGFVKTGQADTPEEMLRKIRLAQATQNFRWGGKKKYKK